MKPARYCSSKDLLDFEFEVHGTSDSDHAKDIEGRKSISGRVTYLEQCPITIKCNCQTVICLSSCESELYSATKCAQDLMYIYRLMKEIGLKVKLPMKLYMDNQGAIDLVNNWSSGG